MGAFRNTNGTRLHKKNNGHIPRVWYILIIGVVVIVTIFFTVSKVKTKKLSSDLTPGKIYFKDVNQRHKEDVNNEGSKNKPDSFTFYKSLNGKEGNIIPLSGTEQKTEKNKKDDVDVKPPQPEKILEIEEKIDKNIEKMVKKEIIYTVQIAAFSSEETANDIITKLKKIGHVPYLVRETDVNGKKLIKVRVGKFPSIVDAQSVAKALKQGGYDTYVIKN